jgi:UDP-N-acetylmuramoylalanine--D-glutamate ligase
LEKTALFKPYISIILNITDDHMDRYKVFSDYFNEKLKVFMNQDRDDILILNHDADKIGLLKNVAHSKVMFYSRLNKPGKDNGICCYVSGGSVRCAVGGRDAEICAVSDIKLKGVHNIENMLACCLAAVLTGIGAASIRKTIINFTGLRHRFETVDTIEGVEYVDDSKGTTVDSTLRALESCEKPVVLIAGGRDKNSYYSVVRETVKKKVRHLILIGEARKAIAECLKDVVPIHEANGMLEAVRLARRLSDKGSMVLLSPMCSSFDMFRDYKERGEVFAAAVKSLRQTFRESEI